MRKVGEEKRQAFARKFVRQANLGFCLKKLTRKDRLTWLQPQLYPRVGPWRRRTCVTMKLRWRHRLQRALNWLAGWLRGRSDAAPSLPSVSPAENHRADLERTLGYNFKRSELLVTALTHPSAAIGVEPHYERLEFLGDAVLDLAIADLLMRRFPEAKEGVLSKERASIVNGRTLAAQGAGNRTGPNIAPGQRRREKRRARQNFDSRGGIRGRDRRDLH